MDSMCLSVLLIIACISSGALSSSVTTQCKTNALSCLVARAKARLPQIFGGIPELGIVSSDPQFVDIIEGDLPTLKYKLTNTTITGFKTCNVSELKFNDDITSSQSETHCEAIRMDGQYEVKGSLLSLPIEGKGDYSVITGNYKLNIDTLIEKLKGNDGATHLAISDFKLKLEPLAPVIFDFKNLFNGQEDLANVVKMFAKEHWREITEMFQEPIWTTIFNHVRGNINKFLESLPLENLVHLN